jgi:DNA phosphorothioation-dependent restriction protein DptH
MSGDETLAVRTVAHKPKGPQKVVFALEDFDEIDEAARFEAFVRVSATGQTQVSPADTEDFILEFGHYKGDVSSTAGPVIRCLVEGVVTIDSKEDFDIVLKELHHQCHEDKKGYVAWRSPSGRSFRVLRPSLIREVELDWASRTGALGRWIVRVRADGSRAQPVRFHGIERVNLSEDLWNRLAKASRRLCEEMANGPGLVAWVHASRLPVI